jgi:hypothetical protein
MRTAVVKYFKEYMDDKWIRREQLNDITGVNYVDNLGMKLSQDCI